MNKPMCSLVPTKKYVKQGKHMVKMDIQFDSEGRQILVGRKSCCGSRWGRPW